MTAWNKGKKTSPEQRKKLSEAHRGIKLSDEHRKRISNGHKGIIFTDKHKQKLSASARGNKNGLGTVFTEEQRHKISERTKGEKNHFWKGGVCEFKVRLRKSFKYRQWRSDVYTRDEFTCQKCLVRGQELEAHHIKRVANILEEYGITTIEQSENCDELWNINNGITYCKSCHRNLHKNKPDTNV